MSGYFHEAPIRVLADEAELRAALAAPEDWFKGSGRWTVKSLWLIALIDEIALKQYPYNLTVQREAEKRLALPESPENGSPMSFLVYAAQCYRHTEQRIAKGFRPFTDDVLAEAHRLGLELEFESGKRATVRQVGGALRAMPPRARKRYYFPDGHPVRLSPARGQEGGGR